jgi:hypothetical protein
LQRGGQRDVSAVHQGATCGQRAGGQAASLGAMQRDCVAPDCDARVLSQLLGGFGHGFSFGPTFTGL